MSEGADFYDPCAEGVPGVIDLGHGVRMKFTGRYGYPDDVRVGLIESHPRPSGEGRCFGGITFDVPEAEGLRGPRWALHSLDPLHVEPSLLCRSCGHHGFIRGGQWVPA